MTVPSTDSRPDAPSGDRGATVPAADPRQVLRLAMRVAIAMLGSGAQTDDVETAIDTTGRAYRIDPIQRSVTFSGIAISYDDPTDGHPPTTLLYTVPERVSDFARLAAASSVVRRIKAGDLDIAEGVVREGHGTPRNAEGIERRLPVPGEVVLRVAAGSRHRRRYPFRRRRLST